MYNIKMKFKILFYNNFRKIFLITLVVWKITVSLLTPHIYFYNLFIKIFIFFKY